MSCPTSRFNTEWPDLEYSLCPNHSSLELPPCIASQRYFAELFPATGRDPICVAPSKTPPYPCTSIPPCFSNFTLPHPFIIILYTNTLSSFFLTFSLLCVYWAPFFMPSNKTSLHYWHYPFWSSEGILQSPPPVGCDHLWHRRVVGVSCLGGCEEPGIWMHWSARPSGAPSLLSSWGQSEESAGPVLCGLVGTAGSHL